MACIIIITIHVVVVGNRCPLLPAHHPAAVAHIEELIASETNWGTRERQEEEEDGSLKNRQPKGTTFQCAIKVRRPRLQFCSEQDG